MPVTEIIELHPKIQEFNRRCAEREIRLAPEYGDRAVYQGHIYFVAAVSGDTLALLDDLAGAPLCDERIVYAEGWENDPACLFLPSLENLLLIVRQLSSVYPSMTPGVQDGREMWRVLHTGAPPFVTETLLEALLDLAIHLLKHN